MSNELNYSDSQSNEMDMQTKANPNDNHNMQLNEYTQRDSSMSMQRPNPQPIPQDQDTYSEILAANIGAYVLIQFLIGSTSVIDKEGYLYAVGVNFVTIYEPLDDRYVVCDLYSVKFVSIFNSPPTGSSLRTNNAMNFSGSQNGRNMRNYSQSGRRMY